VAGLGRNVELVIQQALMTMTPRSHAEPVLTQADRSVVVVSDAVG
jgi:hypothetical protein